VSLSLLYRPEETPPADRPDGGHEATASAAASTPTLASSAGSPAGPAPTASRVLVVDDTFRIRTEIRLLLEEAGLTVVGEGSHGAEGVMLARELRPDVVVMDVRMPILDGIAATGYITRELPGTRVIVFSAFEDEELADAARAAGATRFLTKGASPAEIAAAVRDAAPGG
jgi:DNA-binding NarL/FixJ family response regulator